MDNYLSVATVHVENKHNLSVLFLLNLNSTLANRCIFLLKILLVNYLLYLLIV